MGGFLVQEFCERGGGSGVQHLVLGGSHKENPSVRLGKGRLRSLGGPNLGERS